MTHLYRRSAAVLAVLVALPLVGRAHEGFWPFNRIPKAAIKQQMGIDLSDQWIERVQQTSVRFPSGSGSFVSPDGLVLTNHHVSLDLLHKMGTAERDLAGKGFLAPNRNGELKGPSDLELMSLQKIEDVTAKVNASVMAGMSPADTLGARRAAIAAIEKDAQASKGLEAEVVTLYQQRQANDDFFSIENSLKSWHWQIGGLNEPSLLNKKRADEKALRGRVQANANLSAKYGDAWDQVATARAALLPYNLERVFLDSGLGFYTTYFNTARTLVRWADESAKPNGQRLPEYSDARKAAIERQMASEAPLHAGAEQAKLEASLGVMQQQLGANHALVRQIMAGKTPKERAAELMAGTKMGDAPTRKALFAGGKKALDASADSMIQLAKLVDTRARELRTRYDNEVLAVERDAYSKIAQSVFATQGDAAYPDGTFTLRMSFGQVKGYMENGRQVTPFTEVRGLFIRGDEHKHKPPYKIVDSWVKARVSLNPTTPYNFVSSNDIVGGNSGSPVINVKGELVGLIFDGNIQSLPGYFVYDAAVNRAVAVDSRGMLEALRKVYNANWVADELVGRPSS